MYANVVGSSDFFLQGEVGQAIWWYHWTPGDQNHGQWTGRQAFKAGESVTCNAAPAPLDGIDFTLFGYVLTAP